MTMCTGPTLARRAASCRAAVTAVLLTLSIGACGDDSTDAARSEQKVSLALLFPDGSTSLPAGTESVTLLAMSEMPVQIVEAAVDLDTLSAVLPVELADPEYFVVVRGSAVFGGSTAAPTDSDGGDVSLTVWLAEGAPPAFDDVEVSLTDELEADSDGQQKTGETPGREISTVAYSTTAGTPIFIHFTYRDYVSPPRILAASGRVGDRFSDTDLSGGPVRLRFTWTAPAEANPGDVFNVFVVGVSVRTVTVDGVERQTGVIATLKVVIDHRRCAHGRHDDARVTQPGPGRPGRDIHLRGVS